jgi:hypothetical protein
MSDMNITISSGTLIPHKIQIAANGEPLARWAVKPLVAAPNSQLDQAVAAERCTEFVFFGRA